MMGTSSQEIILTRQQKVAALARIEPKLELTTLAHHIDEVWLREAYRRTRKDGAAGVDGVTAAQYEEALEENLKGLLERFKTGRYRAPPVRRVHIAKAGTPRATTPHRCDAPTSSRRALARASPVPLSCLVSCRCAPSSTSRASVPPQAPSTDSPFAPSGPAGRFPDFITTTRSYDFSLPVACSATTAAPVTSLPPMPAQPRRAWATCDTAPAPFFHGGDSETSQVPGKTPVRTRPALRPRRTARHRPVA